MSDVFQQRPPKWDPLDDERRLQELVDEALEEFGVRLVDVSGRTGFVPFEIEPSPGRKDARHIVN
ncbi:MAG: hypothetical protein ABI639_16640 [Thermoanaerobaculia bacterium]